MHVYMCVRMRVRMCVRVCVQVRMYVWKWLVQIKPRHLTQTRPSEMSRPVSVSSTRGEKSLSKRDNAKKLIFSRA